MSVRHITRRAAEVLCGSWLPESSPGELECGSRWIFEDHSFLVTAEEEAKRLGLVSATRPTCPACSVRLDEMLAAAGR